MSKRKKFEPCDEHRVAVVAMKAAGFNDSEVAKILGTSSRTLRKYYGHEMTHGSHQADREVVTGLLDNVRKGNVAAQIFWCKAKMGWQERVGVDVNGVVPVLVTSSMDASKAAKGKAKTMTGKPGKKSGGSSK